MSLYPNLRLGTSMFDHWMTFFGDVCMFDNNNNNNLGMRITQIDDRQLGSPTSSNGDKIACKNQNYSTK